ncbi:MAG: T9SS type A sorting domain-containing protein [Bacteroidetes bacterium]|nr:T9SS type A sorting domain-containing protein [Bacteroidota bacterium]
MIKNLLFGLLFFFSVNAFSQQTYTVTYNSTSNVTCDIGDTLKFYGTIPGFYGVSIGSSVVIAPHACNTSPYYIGYYVVVSGDNTFGINGTWNGTITVNPGVGLSYTKQQSNKISLFPNPFTSLLKVSSISKAELSVFNITGKSILKQHINEGATELDLSSFAAGVYFIRVGASTYRVIKE